MCTIAGVTEISKKLRREIDASMILFNGRPINREVIVEMKQKIEEHVVQTLGYVLDDKATSWLTNSLLREVKIKDEDGEMLLGECTLFNDYELKELRREDVVFLETVFFDETFGKQLSKHIKEFFD